VSTVTNMKSRTTHTIMEARISGDSLWYSEAPVTSTTWRCNGCGLIWAIKWHAETCESRKHRATWEQVYTVRAEGFTRTGQYKQVSYPRQAVGKDVAYAKTLKAS